MSLHSCVSLTSRIMNSLASREAMLSRLPMEERVLSRKWAWVLRGLPPPLSWYLSTLSFSNDHSGRALSHLCPLYPGWQSQLKEPHSPRHFPWTPQEGPPAVRHTPSVRAHPGALFLLSAALPRSYTWQKTDTCTQKGPSQHNLNLINPYRHAVRKWLGWTSVLSKQMIVDWNPKNIVLISARKRNDV